MIISGIGGRESIDNPDIIVQRVESAHSSQVTGEASQKDIAIPSVLGSEYRLIYYMLEKVVICFFAK